MNVLVTGAKGFVGKHTVLWLKRNNHIVFEYDLESTDEELKAYINRCDFIIHLAGVNRPLTIEEFYDGNTNFTKKLVDLVKESGKEIPIIYSSSTQATLDNDYGKSKRQAELYLASSGLPVYVYRLANVFGKWCRPNYNSACATFCYNIAHNLPITVRDPNYVVTYVYVDDICKEFINIVEGRKIPSTRHINYVKPIYDCSLGKLSELLYYFKSKVESDEHLPLLYSEFEYKLFITFLDYLSDEGYDFNFAKDDRGFFQEHYKSKKWGQISTNMAYPGIEKGGHYHKRKSEIFYTVQGNCVIRQRNVKNNKMLEDYVDGNNPHPVNILVNYTHSIKNIGEGNSLTLMWISEIYNEATPDTFKEPL